MHLSAHWSGRATAVVIGVALSWIHLQATAPWSWGGPSAGAAAGSGGKGTAGSAVTLGQAAALTTPWTLIGEAGGSRDDFMLGGELLAPLLASPDGVLFLYPRVGYQDGGHMNYSIGLGLRRLLPETWGVLGVNAFFDHADYSGLPGFNQIGGGVEYLGHWFEARGNAYFSVSDTKLVDRQRVRQRETSTSTRSSSGWGAPYATGNQILQDRFMFTTTTRVEVTETRVFDRRMAGMDGFDFELGPRLPTGSDAVELRLLAGLYSYDNPFGADLNGFQARAELRLRDRIYLDLAYFEDQQLMGGNVYAGVRVSVPLGRDAPSSADTSASARDRLRARLGEPIVREHRVQVADSGYLENRRLREQRVRESVSTTRSLSGTALLLNDVIFVNNGDPVGNGIMAASSVGTAEQPFPTIQEGADAAGANSTSSGRLWNVYTQWTPTGFMEDVTLSGSANFISSFTPVPGFGGRNFGGNTPRPVLDGGFVSTNIPFTGITGYEILNGDGDGFGIRLRADGFNDVASDIFDNVFSGLVDDPISISAFDVAIVFADIVDNRFSSTSSGSGIGITSNDFSTIDAFIVRNSFDGMIANAALVATGTTEGDIGLLILNNTVGGSYQSGFLIQGLDNAFFDMAMWDNIFMPTNLVDHGVLMRTFNTARIESGARGNTFSGSFNEGVTISASMDSRIRMAAHDNTLTGDFSNGISLTSEGASVIEADLRDNLLAGNYFNGILTRSFGTSAQDINIHTNLLEGSFAGRGILGDAADMSRIDFTVNDNTLSGDFQFGVNFLAREQSAHSTMQVVNNDLEGDFQQIGIWIAALDQASITNPVVGGNRLSGEFDNLGILLQGDNNATITAAVVGSNILSGNFAAPVGEGLRVENRNNAQIGATVANNQLTGNFAFVGMRLINVQTGTTNIINFGLNQFTGNFSDTALWIDETAGTLTVNGTLNNLITGPTTNFLLRSDGTPTGTITINGAAVVLPANITP